MIVLRVREEILREFPAVKPEEVEQWVFKGEDDPAGWAPGALVIINTESSSIPNPALDWRAPWAAIEGWARISARLPQGVHAEAVNNNIVAVWGTP